jgi:hypothetical protein
MDGAGNLFAATIQCDDEYGCYHMIKRRSATGVIESIAGTPGYYGSVSGDGGPATNANLGYISGIAVDQAGSVFISDFQGHRIRKISINGTINTIAGNSITTDGRPPVRGYAGDNGLALRATLNYPAALAVDNPGDVYVADGLNQAVRLLHLGPEPTPTSK